MWGDLFIDGYFCGWEHFYVFYTSNDDFWWKKYRQNFSLSLFKYSQSKMFPLVSQKLKKEIKRERRGSLSVSQHHYWILSHL